jgi:hypothetical protein
VDYVLPIPLEQPVDSVEWLSTLCPYRLSALAFSITALSGATVRHTYAENPRDRVCAEAIHAIQNGVSEYITIMMSKATN